MSGKGKALAPAIDFLGDGGPCRGPFGPQPCGKNKIQSGIFRVCASAAPTEIRRSRRRRARTKVLRHRILRGAKTFQTRVAKRKNIFVFNVLPALFFCVLDVVFLMSFSALFFLFAGANAKKTIAVKKKQMFFFPVRAQCFF